MFVKGSLLNSLVFSALRLKNRLSMILVLTNILQKLKELFPKKFKPRSTLSLKLNKNFYIILNLEQI